ncbi:unnamed protein product, partial [Mycena citricolor]
HREFRGGVDTGRTNNIDRQTVLGHRKAARQTLHAEVVSTGGRKRRSPSGGLAYGMPLEPQLEGTSKQLGSAPPKNSWPNVDKLRPTTAVLPSCTVGAPLAARAKSSTQESMAGIRVIADERGSANCS